MVATRTVTVVVAIAVLAVTAGPVAAQDNTTTPANNTTTTDTGDDVEWGDNPNSNNTTENATGPNERLAQLGDVTITGWEDRDGDTVAVHLYAEEPRTVYIATPYGHDLEEPGVGKAVPVSLDEHRLSRGENTITVEVPDIRDNDRVLYVQANGQRSPILVEKGTTETPVNNLAPMGALLLGALVALTSAGYGAYRAIKRGKGKVRRAKP
ncbi:hypothetical protein [Halostella pelagica]|uniref:hypothetical protein n=1 Tax=Halostella pelagica TaxID=2583824 RepID=UPI001080B256|nr:hypothetical protein [Halostella pelagica]